MPKFVSESYLSRRDFAYFTLFSYTLFFFLSFSPGEGYVCPYTLFPPCPDNEFQSLHGPNDIRSLDYRNSVPSPFSLLVHLILTRPCPDVLITVPSPTALGRSITRTKLSPSPPSLRFLAGGSRFSFGGLFLPRKKPPFL